MSRIKVKGDYSPNGAYELRIIEGSEAGQVYQAIVPGSVFSIGNSIGGYYAKPIKFAGSAMISLFRIGGSEKCLSSDQLRRATRGEKGLVLKPGFVGLWAETSGSARRGIFHKLSEPTDEIEQMLDDLGAGRRILHRVEKIDGVVVEKGGSSCSHNVSGGYYYATNFDGESVEISPPTYASENHINQYHRGCCESSGTYSITGGSYLAWWHSCQAGGWKKDLRGLWITPEVDPNMIRELLFPDSTFAEENRKKRDEQEKVRSKERLEKAKIIFGEIESSIKTILAKQGRKVNSFPFKGKKYYLSARLGVRTWGFNPYGPNDLCCVEVVPKGVISSGTSLVFLGEALSSGLLEAWAEALKMEEKT